VLWGASPAVAELARLKGAIHAHEEPEPAKMFGCLLGGFGNDRYLSRRSLLERAGMSRSTFALKFKQTVGESPMEYLIRWRMLLAGEKLVNSSDPISIISRSLGYESESAFSTAFERVMGSSPRQYKRGRNPASPSPSQGKAAHASRLELIAD